MVHASKPVPIVVPNLRRAPNRSAGAGHGRGYFTNAGRSLALMRSSDGFDWQPAARPLVSGTEFRRADGTMQKLSALERPQVWFDRGEPAVLFCAASIGTEMQSASTFNVAIPLRRS